MNGGGSNNIVYLNSDDRNKSKLPKHLIKDAAKWIIVPSKIILDPESIWPETQNNFKLFIHVIYLLCYLFVLVGQYYNITDKNAKLTSICYTLLLTITIVETTSRRWLCYFYREKLTNILSKIYYEFWPSTIAGENLHKKLKTYNSLLFFFTSGYTFSAFLCVLQMILLPFSNTKLPFATMYPFSWNKSPWFELLYVWQSFLQLDLVFNICGLDLFFLSLLTNCVAQFKLLRAFLFKSFNEIIEKAQDDDKIRLKEATKILLLCIQHHNKLIYVCKELEGAFTYFLLIQYLASIGTVCVSTFVAVVVQEDIGMAFTYLIGHISEILIYCYMGNELINESTKLSDSIFHCGWEHLQYDKNLQKSLIMVMIRAQNSIRISVGGFGFLSLPGFFKLMQFSFSIYALLNSLLQKQAGII